MENTKAYRSKFEDQARALVDKMTLDEKILLMGGHRSFQRMMLDFMTKGYNYVPYGAGGNKRLGISEMMFCDGPRGVVCGAATCFPVAMARGAAFDRELEARVGDAIGKEVRACGGNFFGGTCIEIPYHPGSGRTQEVFSEDPYLMGEIASASVKGIQAHSVLACLKHFAFNTMENNRFKVNVIADKRTEREVYFRAYKKCIDAGAAAVMSAYNKYNGQYCGHSKYLISDVIKTEWGFDGIVISDFIFCVRDTKEAVNAGLDVEMCHTKYYKPSKIKKLIQKGEIDPETIDKAALRITRTMLAFSQDDDKKYDASLAACREHVELARETAEKSITLLKNKNGILPFDANKIKKIVIAGDLADKHNTGDEGSSWVKPPFTVTLEQGIGEALPKAELLKVATKDIAKHRDDISEADAVVIACGNRYNDEGEYAKMIVELGGGDRKSLRLRDGEIKMIKEVAQMNENTAVVLFGGNMIFVNDWAEDAPALLMAYYPGMEGGTALADILFGNVSPSGKLPFVIVKSEEDLPEISWKADEQKYDYYHGYKKIEKEGKKPDFHFGFGLSYTTFELTDIHLKSIDLQTAVFSADIKNTGKLRGGEVIQLYIGYKGSEVDRPIKELKAFEKVYLDPMESKKVMLNVSKKDLAFYDNEASAWKEEDITYTAYIGTDAGNANERSIDFNFLK